MAEVFHKGNILQLQRHTPSTIQRFADQAIGGIVDRSIKAIGRGSPGPLNSRQAFRAVPTIAVITGRIPEQQAGSDHIKLVFGEQRRIPAGTLDIKISAVKFF